MGKNFADNKKALNEISVVSSKGLKNEISGHITKFIKKEIREEKSKQAHIEDLKNELLSEEGIEISKEVSETVVDITTEEKHSDNKDENIE